MEWPARSCDPNPLDYFFWGYIDSKVKARQPKTIAQLKRYIKQEMESITPEMLTKTINNFSKRIHKCIERDGAQFAHLLK